MLNGPFFHISQCFGRQFMNFPCKKKEPNPPPRADDGRKIKVAGLGQRFLGKIQNGGRRFTLDRLECLGWRKFYWLITFFGFD